MTRTEYYEMLKVRARAERARFGLRSPCVLRSDLRRIFRATGIHRIDFWPPKHAPRRARLRTLRGAYFKDELGATVMLPRGLPAEPLIFSMAHELKHHLCDSDAVGFCAAATANESREIGAEIFAAELIYPEEDFRRDLADRGCKPGTCTAADLVRLKHDTGATLSYAGLVKRAEWCGFAVAGSLASSPWRALERVLYGAPPFLRRRTHPAR